MVILIQVFNKHEIFLQASKNKNKRSCSKSTFNPSRFEIEKKEKNNDRLYNTSCSVEAKKTETEGSYSGRMVSNT